MTGVILAAGMGRRLGAITQNLPKCLLEVGGQTLLERQIRQFKQNGIRHIHVVVGHAADKIYNVTADYNNITYIFNKEFAESNSAYSLYLALRKIRGNILCTMGDCFFGEGALTKIVVHNGDFAIAVAPSYVFRPDDVKVSLEKDKIVRIGKGIAGCTLDGLFVGAVKFTEKVVEILHNDIANNISLYKRKYTIDVYDSIIRNGLVKACPVDISGSIYGEIDTVEDFYRLKQIFSNDDNVRGLHGGVGLP